MATNIILKNQKPRRLDEPYSDHKFVIDENVTLEKEGRIFRSTISKMCSESIFPPIDQELDAESFSIQSNIENGVDMKECKTYFPTIDPVDISDQLSQATQFLTDTLNPKEAPTESTSSDSLTDNPQNDK